MKEKIILYDKIAKRYFGGKQINTTDRFEITRGDSSELLARRLGYSVFTLGKDNKWEEIEEELR
jgi:hypothetical protein